MRANAQSVKSDQRDTLEVIKSTCLHSAERGHKVVKLANKQAIEKGQGSEQGGARAFVLVTKGSDTSHESAQIQSA